MKTIVISALFLLPSLLVHAKGEPKATIFEALQSHNSEISACYREGLNRNRKLHGTVHVSIEVAADGSIADATVEKSDLKDKKTEICIINEIKTWTFEPPGEPVRISYPFKLQTKHKEQ